MSQAAVKLTNEELNQANNTSSNPVGMAGRSNVAGINGGATASIVKIDEAIKRLSGKSESLEEELRKQKSFYKACGSALAFVSVGMAFVAAAPAVAALAVVAVGTKMAVSSVSSENLNTVNKAIDDLAAEKKVFQAPVDERQMMRANRVASKAMAVSISGLKDTSKVLKSEINNKKSLAVGVLAGATFAAATVTGVAAAAALTIGAVGLYATFRKTGLERINTQLEIATKELESVKNVDSNSVGIAINSLSDKMDKNSLERNDATKAMTAAKTYGVMGVVATAIAAGLTASVTLPMVGAAAIVVGSYYALNASKRADKNNANRDLHGAATILKKGSTHVDRLKATYAKGRDSKPPSKVSADVRSFVARNKADSGISDSPAR